MMVTKSKVLESVTSETYHTYIVRFRGMGKCVDVIEIGEDSVEDFPSTIDEVISRYSKEDNVTGIDRLVFDGMSGFHQVEVYNSKLHNYAEMGVEVQGLIALLEGEYEDGEDSHLSYRGVMRCRREFKTQIVDGKGIISLPEGDRYVYYIAGNDGESTTVSYDMVVKRV